MTYTYVVVKKKDDKDIVGWMRVNSEWNRNKIISVCRIV